MKRKEAENKQFETEAVQSFEVLRVKDTGKLIFFDVKINGVTIYGCRVVEGQAGDFIGFPSQKGKDGRFYNIVYMPLAAEDQQKILAAVESML